MTEWLSVSPWADRQKSVHDDTARRAKDLQAELAEADWQEERRKMLVEERSAAIRESVRYAQERDAIVRRFEKALAEGAKRQEERDSLRTMCAELIEALQPMENEAKRYERLVLGQDIDGWKITNTELTMGDLRKSAATITRARTLLETKS